LIELLLDVSVTARTEYSDDLHAGASGLIGDAVSNTFPIVVDKMNQAHTNSVRPLRFDRMQQGVAIVRDSVAPGARKPTLVSIVATTSATIQSPTTLRAQVSGRSCGPLLDRTVATDP